VIGDENIFVAGVINQLMVMHFPGGLSATATVSVRTKPVRGSAGRFEATIASVIVMEWESAPLMACAETVKFPMAAFSAAPKTTDAAVPGTAVKGLAGLEVTPGGRSANVIWTAEVKPLCGEMEKDIAELASP